MESYSVCSLVSEFTICDLSHAHCFSRGPLGPEKCISEGRINIIEKCCGSFPLKTTDPNRDSIDLSFLISMEIIGSEVAEDNYQRKDEYT